MKTPFRLFSSIAFIGLTGLFFSPAAIRASNESPSRSAAGSSGQVSIPGSLRSFLRMAGISQKVSPPEVLPFLAHNVVSLGFMGDGAGAKPTEFLKLLKNYLDQARELSAFAGPEGIIRVSNCDEAKPLLSILGYQLREACGPGTSVITSDPEKAFLAIDSGFPVADLEETLRGGKPLVYRFGSFQVPVLFSTTDWVSTEKGTAADVLDALINDRSLARLYWALSRMDSATAADLRQSMGLQKLIPFAPGLDFYGSNISIRAGKVLVPGGVAAEVTWKELVGTSPESPTPFVLQLLTKDDGWLAAYFDALSRINATQQAYFVDAARMKLFYEALRGPEITPSAVKGVFRPDPGLLLLMTRLPLDPSGQPHIPGTVAAWKDILREKSSSKIGKFWNKRAKRVDSPDQLIEAMCGLSREGDEDNPLAIFLAMTEIDRYRSPEQRLTPQTVRAMASRYSLLSDQYLVFSEFHALDNASIAKFVTTAMSIDRLPDTLLRADTLGMFQASVGLWQIFARQGQIPEEKINDSWQKAIEPFADIHSSNQLFDADRVSLNRLTEAVTGKANLSQDEILALLAGPVQQTAEGQEERQAITNRLHSVMDDQRLIPLDTLFQISDGLNQMAQGAPATDALIQLTGELRENDMPKPIFSPGERSEWAAGIYNSRHIAMQRQTDIAKAIKSHHSAEELLAARGQLASFVRDTVVGLNYAYYEPPGAQMLHSNPLLVRSHDFSGAAFSEKGEAWKSPVLIGKGSPASGGAHLSGSLADLPYALARAEQNFVVPENVQALIWEEMVPSLLTGAVVPRWWGVSRNEMHAVALYQETGEELLKAASKDPQVREKVMAVLSDRFSPARAARVDASLAAGDAEDVVATVMPGETFYLAVAFRQRNPGEKTAWGKAGTELDELCRQFPDDASLEKISRDFGVPHPVVTHSYTLEFLEIRPFPSFTEYPSRLLAESWDSNNLYWARLADELNYAPVMLNTLVPELTRRMVEKIFASNFEDWPALLRAIDETGAEFRVGGVAALQTRTDRSKD